jgi:eukaryotic-like serine/threonine-protein kinase
MASEPHFDGCDLVEMLRSGPATDWYVARQHSLGRRVVIKALSPNLAPDSAFASPLVREAQLLAQLHHKNIVQLYDFVQRPRSMWLVLEHVDGITLDELLKQGALSVPVALAIAAQLVDTLGYLHSQKVVHCDVRPKNIWISRAGDVKLTNFFLAQQQSVLAPPELLEADSGFEIPSYLSPEQLLSESVDARSDLFSTGVVLFEMVSAQRPFDASDTRTTTQRIRHEPPPALSRLAPEVPPSVERIVVRALQKLPADRFHDAEEMAQLIAQGLAQYPAQSVVGWVRSVFEASGTAEALKPPVAARALEAPTLLRRAALVYGVCLLCLLAGGALIQRSARGNERSLAPRAAALELMPSNAGYLSCVARPWAHVFVDGQLVETTPFARPIALSAGTHYLRFEHPNAPAERRTVVVEPGQRLFVEVEMQLPVRPVEAEPDLMRPRGDAGAHSP